MNIFTRGADGNEEWRELNLEEQLAHWYELLAPKRKILYDFANQDFTVRLDYLLIPSTDTTTTVVLDWALQRRMVRIGVDLTLCIYPPTDVNRAKSFSAPYATPPSLPDIVLD